MTVSVLYLYHVYYSLFTVCAIKLKPEHKTISMQFCIFEDVT